MKIEIYPSQLEGTIRIPGSKSAAQRFLAGALMSNGKTIIREFPQGDDVESSLKIIQALGAVVQQKGNQVEIKGGFPSSFRSGIRNPKAEIQCGESGLAARMFIPISALHNETITVNGTGSLLSRPFDGIVEPLESLGAKVKTNSTYLPVQIKGPLRGGSATVDGRLSSQFLSGLLFALPLCKLDSELTVEQLKSKPYISMSLEILRSFRIEIEQVDSTLFRIAGNQVFQAQDCTVPGDWSGAACIIVAGVLCSEQGIVLEGLSNQLTQGDAAIAQILKKMGASIEQKSNSIRVSKSTIRAFEFDATDCPDLFPPLCALAAFADGPSVLKGANRLRHKESNRGKRSRKNWERPISALYFGIMK